MDRSFDEILQPEPAGEGAFRFHVPPGWEQGKAIFGGLVLGGLVRAMAASLRQPERRLRSLQAELIGSPAVGPTDITTRILREGGAVSAAGAELRQGGAVLCHAVGIFGSTRAAAEAWCAPRPPESPPWRQVDPLDMSVPFAPAFARNFEYRPLRGVPFSAQPGSETAGWIRPRRPGARRDDAYLVALADAWWLAVMVGLPAPRPAATLGFSLELHASPEELDPEAPLLHRGVAPVLREGYGSETRELWTPEGRLVSLNRQLVCIIK